MDKYSPLQNFLSKVSGLTLKMIFKEIESVLGDSLPKSAYKYSAWWVNGEKAHKHSLSWVDAGWKVELVELGEYVIIKRKGIVILLSLEV